MENVYSAPRADLSTAPEDDDTYQPKIWALSGRLGRIRYLAYMNISMIILLFLIGILAAVLLPIFAKNDADGFGVAVMGLLYVPILAVSFILAKRRLNDLNHSGWWGLLMIIPFLNILIGLYLVFGPGTAGTNRFGKQPNKNPTWLFLVIFVPIIIGILAAIALPAYQQYTEKARAAGARIEVPMPSGDIAPKVPVAR